MGSCVKEARQKTKTQVELLMLRIEPLASGLEKKALPADYTHVNGNSYYSFIYRLEEQKPKIPIFLEKIQ